MKVAPRNETQDVILQCKTAFVEHDLQHNSRHQEMTDVLLSAKIEEYIQRLGPFNHNLDSIFIHLLVFGKVKIQFRNHADRLQMKAATDLMSRRDASNLFDKIRDEVMRRMSLNDVQGATQRIVIEEPQIHLPTKKVKFFT